MIRHDGEGLSDRKQGIFSVGPPLGEFLAVAPTGASFFIVFLSLRRAGVHPCLKGGRLFFQGRDFLEERRARGSKRGARSSNTGQAC